MQILHAQNLFWDYAEARLLVEKGTTEILQTFQFRSVFNMIKSTPIPRKRRKTGGKVLDAFKFGLYQGFSAKYRNF